MCFFFKTFIVQLQYVLLFVTLKLENSCHLKVEGIPGYRVDSYHLLVQSSCESHPGMHWHFWSVHIPFLLQSAFELHMNSENIFQYKFILCKAISDKIELLFTGTICKAIPIGITLAGSKFITITMAIAVFIG